MFPPGALSSYHLEGIEGAAQRFTLLFLILPVASSLIAMNTIDTMKSFGVVALGLLPLAVFLYARKVTESDWLAAVSSWLTAFSAPLAAQLWVGDYTLLTGLLMSYITAGVLMVYVSSGASKRALLLLAFSVLLTSLTDATSAMIVAGFIVSTAILGGQSLDGFAPLIFLGATPVIAQLALVLLSPTGAGVAQFAPVVRFDYLADPISLGVLVIASTLGAVAIARRSGVEKLNAPAWFVIAPVMASGMLGSSPQAALAYVVPSLLTLASSALIWTPGVLTLDKVREKGDEEVTEVTVDVPRATLVALVAYLIMSSTLSMPVVSASYYNQNSVARYFTDRELTSAIDWIRENLSPGSTIMAHPAVAPWLQAMLPNRVIGFRDLEERMVGEAVARTNFRIQTPFLVVDEWQPYSTSKSPVVFAYDGVEYVDLLLIDDSFVRTFLTKAGVQYVESSFGAAYLRYQLEEDHESFVLTQVFITHGLEIQKTIRTYKAKAIVQLDYIVKPRAGVSLNQLVMPVRILPGGPVPNISVEGSTASFSVRGIPVQLSFSSPSGPIEVGTWDEANLQVVSVFEPEEGVIRAGVTITIEPKGSSGLPAWAGSIADLLARYHVDYVISQADYDPFAKLAGTRKRLALSIIDSFNRIAFEQGQSVWVEAPSNAVVAEERSRTTDNGEERFVSYRTAGLRINKTLLLTPGNFTMFFDIAARDSSSRLLSANLTLWIPWAAILVNHTTSGNTATLYTDAGPMLLRFSAGVTSVEIGEDPEFGQLRILATFNLQAAPGRVGMMLLTDSRITYEYIADSRPHMETCDRTVLYLGSDLYADIVRFGALKLYATSADGPA